MFNSRHLLIFCGPGKVLDNTTFKQLSARQTSGMFSRIKCLLLCNIFNCLLFIEDFYLSWIFFVLFWPGVLKTFAGAGKTGFDQVRESRRTVLSFRLHAQVFYAWRRNRVDYSLVENESELSNCFSRNS